MKRLLFLITLVLFLTPMINAQNKSEQFFSEATVRGRTFNLDEKKAPKTKEDLAKGAKLTEAKAIYKGETYPVYLTNTGKLFIIIQAKTSGNWYRKYIKESTAEKDI